MSDDDLHWYALDVVRQKEYVAGFIFQRMGCFSFIPTETRWRKRNRYTKSKAEVAFAALPGVIFVGFPGPPNWFQVMSMHLVTGVLSTEDRPHRLHTDTQEWMAYRATQLDGYLVLSRVKARYRGEDIDRSVQSIFVQGRGILRAPKEQKHMRSKKEFKAGDRVMVSGGPMRFETVTVKKITGSRAEILLPLFGGATTTISTADLEGA